jgi:peptide/nickel transport system permease protein
MVEKEVRMVAVSISSTIVTSLCHWTSSVIGSMVDGSAGPGAPRVVTSRSPDQLWWFSRSQMIEVLRQDYIRVAEAKGLPQRLVIFRHGLRNAILPLVTLLALDLPTLFSGAVVTETIFTWNGLGRLIVDSTFKRDYTVVMGVVLFISFLTVVANLLADILYAQLDPRIRYD